MKRISIMAAGIALFAQQGFAEGAGLQFEDMEIGTRLVVQGIDSEGPMSTTEFTGTRDGFFTTVAGVIDADGVYEERYTSIYDAEGRLVRKEYPEVVWTYEPYSCDFVVGECTHTLTYPNSQVADEAEYFVRVRNYSNRIEDGIFIVNQIRDDGQITERRYELDAFNFKVSSRYTRYNGDEGGWNLVEVTQP